MKFKLIKPGLERVPGYGGNIVSTGDVIELEGALADKANRNPDFEKVHHKTKVKRGNKNANQK